MFLMCRITESKRRHGQEQNELNKQRITEKELTTLNLKINKLLNKLEEHEQEIATSIEEECVICIQSKASVTTYPCNHCVICRRCFVKTIQNAVSQKNLPLRCVICRAKILRLKQSFNSELLLETTRPGKYKRNGRGAYRGTSGYPYGYQQAAKATARAGGYSKNAKKCSPEISLPLSGKSTCKKRITQQAAINQGNKDQRGSIESRKVDLEKLKVAERSDPNNSASANKSAANPVACGRHSSETGETARCATPGAPNASVESVESRSSPNHSNESGLNEEEISSPSRSLSPELESSRKRIEKLNKLTSERSLNQRTLKARIFNYFSFARTTPRCPRPEHDKHCNQDGELEPSGELDYAKESKSDSDCCPPPKKKTTWSARFQKFKCKTNACLNEVRILLDL